MCLDSAQIAHVLQSHNSISIHTIHTELHVQHPSSSPEACSQAYCSCNSSALLWEALVPQATGAPMVTIDWPAVMTKQ